MNIFTIKIIALILMLMDHIGEFFPDSPIWFRWLGRLAAPLFSMHWRWGSSIQEIERNICCVYIWQMSEWYF